MSDQAVLEFIAEYTEENGYPPVFREICGALELNDWHISGAIKRLRAEGLLVSMPGAHRTYKVNEDRVKSIGNRFFVPKWLLSAMYRRIPGGEEKDVVRLFLTDLGLEIDED